MGIENILKMAELLRVVISGTKSGWMPVSTDAPQRSVLGSILVNVFIANRGDGTEHTLSEPSKGTSAGWRNWQRRISGSSAKESAKSYTWGGTTPRTSTGRGADQLLNSFAKNDTTRTVSHRAPWRQSSSAASWSALGRALPVS